MQNTKSGLYGKSVRLNHGIWFFFFCVLRKVENTTLQCLDWDKNLYFTKVLLAKHFALTWSLTVKKYIRLNVVTCYVHAYISPGRSVIHWELGWKIGICGEKCLSFHTKHLKQVKEMMPFSWQCPYHVDSNLSKSNKFWFGCSGYENL